MSMDRSIEVCVTEVEEVAPLIKRFTLEAADGGELPAFSGGAHIVIEMRDGDRVHRKPYSLLGSPSDRRRYRIAVRRSESGQGGSHYMHETVRPGSVLRISAPMNAFALGEGCGKHVFVAGGVGITPFFAHMAELRAKGLAYELHYAVSSREQAGFLDELATLAGDRMHLYVSTEGRTMDVADLISRQPAGAELYVCGPEGLVAAVLEAARHTGWPASRIHAERFAPAPATAALAAEAAAREATWLPA